MDDRHHSDVRSDTNVRVAIALQQIEYLESNHDDLKHRVAVLEKEASTERELRAGYVGKYNGATAVIVAVSFFFGWLINKVVDFLPAFLGGKVH